ncbi:MAG TPA: right-handed parallel beta-helix repeat-containing protein [Candidatus Bathyarchaeia archaeon]|nr:right-handed parallel beta-helix repeat-containing protein [Candidatus Bathyarchaeia archaeon]
MKKYFYALAMMSVICGSFVRSSEPPFPPMPPYDPSSGKSLFGVASNTNTRLQPIEENIYYIATVLEDIDSDIENINTVVMATESMVENIESITENIDTQTYVIESITENIDTQVYVLESMVTVIDSKIDVIETIVNDIDVTVSVIENISTTIEAQVAELLDMPSCASTVLSGNGPFEITESGPYCLGENITFNQAHPTAINIFTDEVVLDLNGYSITGDGTVGTVAINTNNHVSIVIYNGFINNCDTAIEIGNGSLIKISNVMTSDVLSGISASSITGLYVDNCFFEGLCSVRMRTPITCSLQKNGINIANGAQVAIRSTTITECSNGMYFSNVSGVFVIDCSMYDNVNNGINMNNNIVGGVIAQCSAAGNLVTGFAMTGVENVSCQNCNASDNTTGFSVDSSSVALNMNDCESANNSEDGFTVAGDNVTIKNCSAKGNENNGFTLTGIDMTVDSCVAVENSMNGIAVGAAASDTIIRGTVTNSNGSGVIGDGILINASAENTQVFNCSIANNANLGVNNGPGSSISMGSSKIFNNIAYSNTGADFSGIPLSVIASTLGAIAGATYWINISL